MLRCGKTVSGCEAGHTGLGRRQWLAWVTTIAAAGGAFAQSVASPLPKPTTGRIERWANFASRHVDPRHIDIWLPADYSPERRHAVLYMQDGQMLFDASSTWNKQAWQADVAVAALMSAGRIPPTIVVGIWNSGALRHSEYFPQKFLAHVPEPLRRTFIDKALAGRPRADAYLRFVVEELKPAIDAAFTTRPGREHTAVMGSSMGGMISIYAMNEYPQVFGAAAGLSTHWVGAFEPNSALPLAAFNYLQAHLAPPGGGRRLYMDHGTTELDAIYAPYQTFIDQIVRDRGYTAAEAMLRVFPGTGHNEAAWAARLAIPLEFLLGGR